MRGTQVRALHDSDGRPVRLGEDVTDAQGAYTVRYETLPDDQHVRLRRAGSPWLGEQTEAGPRSTSETLGISEVERGWTAELERMYSP